MNEDQAEELARLRNENRELTLLLVSFREVVQRAARLPVGPARLPVTQDLRAAAIQALHRSVDAYAAIAKARGEE